MSIFMYMESLLGEASDPNHKNWVDLLEVTFGVGRSITSVTSTRGDRESSNATISDLKLLKFMDKASAKLFLEACCSTGKQIIIEMTKTGAGQGADTYIRYTLENAIISSLDVEATNDNGYRPLEDITISFTEMSVKYIPYDEDGNAESPIVVGFDTATNQKK